MNQTEILAAELADETYTSLSAAAAATALNAVEITEVYSRFGSFRTLANLLSAAQYTALRTVLDAAAVDNRVIADMIDMLKQAGDDQGTGGGIDFGSASVRATIDDLEPALATALGGETATADATALVALVKGYAERLVSRAQQLGLPIPVQPSDVTVARETLQ